MKEVERLRRVVLQSRARWQDEQMVNMSSIGQSTGWQRGKWLRGAMVKEDLVETGRAEAESMGT